MNGEPSRGRYIFGVGSIHRLPFASQRTRIIRQALEAGFRAFDVAPSYGNGLDECELGRVLGAERYECTIATKFGIPFDDYGSRYPNVFPLLRAARIAFDRAYASEYSKRCFSPDEMSRSLEASLRRLRRDHVDELLVHEPLTPLGRADAEALLERAQRLAHQGKIRAFGVAGPAGTLGSLASDSRIDIVQVPMADAAATYSHEPVSRRYIAYGVFRRFRELGVRLPFGQWVSEVLSDMPRLKIILATTNRATLESFASLLR